MVTSPVPVEKVVMGWPSKEKVSSISEARARRPSAVSLVKKLGMTRYLFKGNRIFEA